MKKQAAPLFCGASCFLYRDKSRVVNEPHRLSLKFTASQTYRKTTAGENQGWGYEPGSTSYNVLLLTHPRIYKNCRETDNRVQMSAA